MSDSYEVLYRSKPVGTVYMERQGLYYNIQCICSGTTKGIYRLIGRHNDVCIRLGVLVPEGGKLVLQTKIPIKKLHAETPEFYLESVVTQDNSQAKPSLYCPIYPDEPFQYLSRLKKSYLEYRDGRPGLVITE